MPQSPEERVQAIFDDRSLTPMEKLLRIFGDPETSKAFLRRTIKRAGESLGSYAKEIGIENPKEFAEYLGVGATIWSAFFVSALNDTSEQLKGLTETLVEEQRQLVAEQRSLASTTRLLTALTAVLTVLTALAVWRTFYP